jgi:hypothetical protein
MDANELEKKVNEVYDPKHRVPISETELGQVESKLTEALKLLPLLRLQHDAEAAKIHAKAAALLEAIVRLRAKRSKEPKQKK